MTRYRYLGAAVLLVALAACEAEEVESPMPKIEAVLGEVSFGCPGGQQVTIIHEAI